MKHTLSPTERAERLEHAHHELVEAVAHLTNSESWLTYLRFQARFRTYSAANTILIWAQCPAATYVAGYRAWQAMGRQVRRGERAIHIFAPLSRRIEREDPDTGETEISRSVAGFRLVSVFDASQTDGESEMPSVPRPVLLSGEAPEQMWDDLTTRVAAAGFTIELVGEVEPSGATNGVTNFTTKVVEIATAGRDAASRARTLAHELAHCLLHGDHQTPRQVAEVEAESVAFLVADAYGLDAAAYTVPYVAAWGSSDPDAVLRSAGRVQRCAAEILGSSRSEAPAEATGGVA